MSIGTEFHCIIKITTGHVKMDSIVEYYAGRSIFITGATGFIGKILIEKILRSLRGVEKVYVLIREKKGRTPRQRVEDIVNCPLFERLKQEYPNAIREKLVVISGDVTKIGLGLSDEDRKILVENVSVVFHSAASVRFDDPLKNAIILNTRGTREVVKLALEMKKLDVFLHVSTTYCNVDRNVVDEKLYPPHADWRKSIEVAENLDRYTLDILTSKYINPLPNTYTFAKSLSEHCVNDLCKNTIPAVIFRPSIVISTKSDPIPGWIDNFNGPVGLFAAVGKGILRVAYGDPNILSDYIAADITVRAILLAAWHKGTTKKIEEKLDLSVYNCSNNEIYALSYAELNKIGMEISHKDPMNKMLWYPNITIINNKTWFYIQMLLFQLLPAIFIDTLLKIFKRKPLLIKIQRRIYAANMALAPFSTKQWTFLNHKCSRLDEKLKADEYEDFGYDKDNFNMYEFVETCIKYGKRYLFKSENVDEEIRRKNGQRMYLLDKFVKGLFYIFLFWLLAYKIKIFGYVTN